MGLFKSKPPPKKKKSRLGVVLLIGIVIVAAKDPGILKTFGSKAGSAGQPVTQIVTTSSFQSCVISRESGGNPSIWNNQGYPYWGLYQFGQAAWDGNGGNPSDWGKSTTSAAEQTQVFYNTMSHYRGCMAWYPSDGCTDPSNGCG
jgi:hypothetical protein